MILCASHGFLYGILYAPSQALLFGLGFNGMIAWIMSGLYFDLIHGISNFMIGTLILPIVNILQKVNKA
jgi:energy-coupling factor transport system substrate-specific component